METELRILLVEDAVNDADIIEHDLRKINLAFRLRRVETRDEFVEALRNFLPDLIFSDYSLPHFNGLTALRLARDLAPKVPFILITGALDEEMAVDCIKAGATDFVLKGHLSRLGLAVMGALEWRKVQIEKELAEEAMRRAEAKYRHIYENVMEGIFQATPEGRFLSSNPAQAHLLGFASPEELMAQVTDIGSQLYVDPERRRDFQRPVEEQGFVKEFEAEFYRRDGSRFWNLTNARAVRDPAGAILYYEGTNTDITARKKAEATILENERRWRAMLENVKLVVVHLNRQGLVEYANPFFYALTGYAPADVIGRNWFEHFVPGRERQSLETVFAELLEQELHLHHQSSIVTESGEERLIAWNNTLLRDTQGGVLGTLSMGEDISGRKRLEEELRQAQKMEAIGRLAGGIAHDFNNLLTAITGYSTLLLEEMPDQDQRRPDVLEIKDAADRACGLTRQLLAFSRKQVLQPKIIDLNKLVTRLSNMLERLIGEDIELRTLLDANLGRVQADPGQIEQVVMNLAVNARDAMANGGHLTIETANVELDEGHLRLPAGVPPGRYVRLIVRDSGCGMDPETQAHLFEPFFTTKQPGKGTGLGLSTVYGIVKQSGGDIQVESAPGVGTAFRIYLPRVVEPAAAKSMSPSLTAAPSGSETVLLVEDDDGVRALLLRLLRQHGYRVLEAQRAGEALALSEQHPNPIHILVTDLVMPQMNGRELAEQLVRQRPDLRILYMSGYTDDGVIRKGILDQNLPFLQKPFAPGAFLRKVRELLNSVPNPITPFP